MRISAFVLAAAVMLGSAGAAFADGGCNWVSASSKSAPVVAQSDAAKSDVPVAQPKG